MAQRWYLTRESAGFSPAPAGAWDDTGGVVRGTLQKVKGALASTVIQRSETNAAAGFDVLLGQWISDPLDTAQTVSGTFDLVILAQEATADAAMVLHVHAWVTQGDTATPRGTLVADWLGAADLPTTEQGVAMPAQTVGGVAAAVGDRLVVEVGYRANNVVATSKTGRCRHGGNGADATAGDTDTTHPGWCEFGTAIADAETRLSWSQPWYFGGTAQGATAVPPLFRGAWDVTASVSTTGAAALLPAVPGVSSSGVALPVGNTTAGTHRLLLRGVSAPLNAGGIPAQTWRVTGLALEAAADQDIVWCVHAWLMAANGDERAVLVDTVADGGVGNEWPTGPAAGRQSDAFAIPATAILQDDRLVVELGGRQLGTPLASGTITIRRGGTGAAAAPGDTDTTRPTWLGVAGPAAVAGVRNQAVVVG